MSAAANKQLMQAVFAELARGNGAPFREALADDVCWTMMGTTRWSRSYRGKAAMLDELLQPLFERFADRYTNTAHRFIAEDDHVVVGPDPGFQPGSGPASGIPTWVGPAGSGPGALPVLTSSAIG